MNRRFIGRAVPLPPFCCYCSVLMTSSKWLVASLPQSLLKPILSTLERALLQADLIISLLLFWIGPHHIPTSNRPTSNIHPFRSLQSMHCNFVLYLTSADTLLTDK